MSGAELITAEQLFRMSSSDIGQCELIEGKLRPYPFATAEQGMIAAEFGFRLGEYIDSNSLGIAVAGGTGFVLGRDPDTVLAPDTAFVKAERLVLFGLSDGYFPEAPALVVEIVSPEDTNAGIEEKMRRWISAGVELGWVIHPRARTVIAYRTLDDIRVFTEKDVLDGDPVLPGFTCRVGEFFSP